MNRPARSRHSRIYDIVCLLLAFIIIVPTLGTPFARAATITEGTASTSDKEACTAPAPCEAETSPVYTGSPVTQTSTSKTTTTAAATSPTLEADGSITQTLPVPSKDSLSYAKEKDTYKLTIGRASGQEISLALVIPKSSKNDTSTRPTVKDDGKISASIASNVETDYVYDTDRIKENIVLKDASAPREYTFKLATKGLNPADTPDGIYFTDDPEQIEQIERNKAEIEALNSLAEKLSGSPLTSFLATPLADAALQKELETAQLEAQASTSVGTPTILLFMSTMQILTSLNLSFFGNVSGNDNNDGAKEKEKGEEDEDDWVIVYEDDHGVIVEGYIGENTEKGLKNIFWDMWIGNTEFYRIVEWSGTASDNPETNTWSVRITTSTDATDFNGEDADVLPSFTLKTNNGTLIQPTSTHQNDGLKIGPNEHSVVFELDGEELPKCIIQNNFYSSGAGSIDSQYSGSEDITIPIFPWYWKY